MKLHSIAVAIMAAAIVPGHASAAITSVDEALDLSRKTGRPVLAIVGHET